MRNNLFKLIIAGAILTTSGWSNKYETTFGANNALSSGTSVEEEGWTEYKEYSDDYFIYRYKIVEASGEIPAHVELATIRQRDNTGVEGALPTGISSGNQRFDTDNDGVPDCAQCVGGPTNDPVLLKIPGKVTISSSSATDWPVWLIGITLYEAERDRWRNLLSSGYDDSVTCSYYFNYALELDSDGDPVTLRDASLLFAGSGLGSDGADSGATGPNACLMSVNFRSTVSRDVSNLNWMFSGDTALETVDLSSFKTSSPLSDVSNTFKNCLNLSTIVVSNKLSIASLGWGFLTGTNMLHPDGNGKYKVTFMSSTEDPATHKPVFDSTFKDTIEAAYPESTSNNPDKPYAYFDTEHVYRGEVKTFFTKSDDITLPDRSLKNKTYYTLDLSNYDAESDSLIADSGDRSVLESSDSVAMIASTTPEKVSVELINPDKTKTLVVRANLANHLSPEYGLTPLNLLCSGNIRFTGDNRYLDATDTRFGAQDADLTFVHKRAIPQIPMTLRNCDVIFDGPQGSHLFITNPIKFVNGHIVFNKTVHIGSSVVGATSKGTGTGK